MTIATRTVRKIMQDAGKFGVYTNLYKTCRSVKCYGHKSNKKDMAMLKKVSAKLHACNIPFTINFTHGAHGDGYGCGIIVRLPL